MEVTKHRSIFISDVHIGIRASKVKELLHFLKYNDCDHLYLLQGSRAGAAVAVLYAARLHAVMHSGDRHCYILGSEQGLHGHQYLLRQTLLDLGSLRKESHQSINFT